MPRTRTTPGHAPCCLEGKDQRKAYRLPGRTTCRAVSGLRQPAPIRRGFWAIATWLARYRMIDESATLDDGQKGHATSVRGGRKTIAACTRMRPLVIGEARYKRKLWRTRSRAGSRVACQQSTPALQLLSTRRRALGTAPSSDGDTSRVYAVRIWGQGVGRLHGAREHIGLPGRGRPALILRCPDRPPQTARQRLATSVAHPTACVAMGLTGVGHAGFHNGFGASLWFGVGIVNLNSRVRSSGRTCYSTS